MKQSQLVDSIKQTLSKLKVIELSRILRQEQFNLHDLIEITHHEDEAIAFRAAWILENLYLERPEIYVAYLQDILNAVPAIKWAGVQRHYAKIVMHATSPKAPTVIKEQMAQLNMEPVIEKLFDWMIDKQVKIAVKAFSAESLYNLRNEHDWIRDELRNQLQFLMKDGSAAIQSRGKKLLKGL